MGKDNDENFYEKICRSYIDTMSLEWVVDNKLGLIIHGYFADDYVALKFKYGEILQFEATTQHELDVIKKNLAYIKRRDRVCLSIGTEEEQEELKEKRAKLQKKIKEYRKRFSYSDKDIWEIMTDSNLHTYDSWQEFFNAYVKDEIIHDIEDVGTETEDKWNFYISQEDLKCLGINFKNDE